MHDEPKTPAVAVRRPRRRWLRILGWSTLGTVLLVGGAIGWLHTRSGQDFVRARVEKALSEKLDGQAHLGGLRFALGGAVGLSDLILIDAEGRDALTLGALDVDLDWGSLLSPPLVIRRLGVSKVRVQLIQDPDGGDNLQRMLKPLLSTPREPKSLTIETLDVRDVELSATLKSGLVAQVSKLTIKGRVEVDVERQRRHIQLTEVGLALSATRPDGLEVSVPAVGLSADITVDGETQTLSLSDLVVDVNATLARPAGAISLTAPLRIAQIEAVIGPAGPDLRLEGLAISELALSGLPNPGHAAPRSVQIPIGLARLTAKIRGGHINTELAGLTLTAATLRRLTADVQLKDRRLVAPPKVTLEALHIDRVALNALLDAPLLATDIDIDARVEGPKRAIAVDGTVKTAGGTLALTGSLDIGDPTRPRYDLRLVGSDIKSAALLIPRAGARIPEVESSLTVTLKGEGMQREGLDAEATVTIGPTRVDAVKVQGVELAAAVRDGRLTVTRFVLKAFDRALSIEGGVDPKKGTASLHVVSKGPLAATLKQLADAGLLVIPMPGVTVGDVDLDISLNAEGVAALGAPQGSAPVAETLLPHRIISKIPLEKASLDARFGVRDVVYPKAQVSVAEAGVTAHIRYDRGAPGGSIHLTARDVLARGYHLDAAEATVTLDGRTARVTLTAQDAKTQLEVALALDVALRGSSVISVTLQTLELARGGAKTRLLEPVTIQIPRRLPAEGAPIKLPPLKLALVGGSLAVSGYATVLPPDPTVEGAPPRVDEAAVTLVLDALDLARLAALVGKHLPVRPTLSGRLDISGLPLNPSADFDLNIRVRPGPGIKTSGRLDLAIRGTASKRRAQAEINAEWVKGGRASKLLELSLDLPLVVTPAERPGQKDKVALSRTGPLHIGLKLPKRRLASLAELLPARVRAKLAGRDLEVRATAEITGTANAPRAQLDIGLGANVAQGQRARVTVTGDLKRRGEGLTSALNLQVRLPQTATTPLLQGDLTASFVRSPLISRRGMRWSAKLEVPERALASLPLPPKAKAQLKRGRIGAVIDLKGTDQDVLGRLAVNLRDLVIQEIGPLNLAVNAQIGAKQTRLGVAVALGTDELVRMAGTVGIGGKGIKARLKDKVRLRRAPLDLVVTLPERALSSLRPVRPQFGRAPGRVKGLVAVTGTVGRPLATAQIDWDGVDTADGKHARASVVVALGKTLLTAALRFGPDPAHPLVEVGVETARRGLLGSAAERRAPLVLETHVSAKEVPMVSLLPARLVKDSPVPPTGRLTWNMQGPVRLDRSQGRPKLAHVGVTGGLAVTGARVTLPGTERTLRDIALRLGLEEDGLVIRKLEAFEDDTEKTNRHVSIQGKLNWKAGDPRSILGGSLTIATQDWLLMGPLDAPQGALTSKTRIDADLLASPHPVTVTVEKLSLWSPHRFPLRHAPEVMQVGDLTFLEGFEHKIGDFWPKKINGGSKKPAQALKIGDWDIDVRFPNGLFAYKSPLYVWFEGGVRAKIRERVSLSGKLTATRGHLEFLGWDFPLEKGSVTLGGKVPAWIDLTFAERTHHTTRRDYSQASAGGDKTRIRIVGPAGKHRLIHSGVGGGFLPEAMSVTNSRRPRWITAPGLAASAMVQFPNSWIGSLINTVLRIHLRHLLFMDQAYGWADPDGDPQGYGRMENILLDRFGADKNWRVRFRTRPAVIGRSRAELEWDWTRLSASERSVFGIGLRVGSRLGGGIGITWDWASQN